MLLALGLTTLLAGCAGRSNPCPHYPIPPDSVKVLLYDLSKERLKAGNPDLWEWGNRLRVLCIQLGDCDD